MLKFVVGLFESKGIAEDAINRLRYEGVPDGNISPLPIRETAPLPAAVSPAIEALSVDPLLVGNVRETFAPFIRNGETAVFVRALDEEQVEFATDVLKLYLPITIEVVPLSEPPGAPPPR